MSTVNQANCRVWLRVLLASSFCLGCQMGKSGVPEDPLFVSRKPIESKATTAAPVAVAFVEPPVPHRPDTALASGKERSRDGTKPSTGKVPGVLTSQPAVEKVGPPLPSVPPR